MAGSLELACEIIGRSEFREMPAQLRVIVPCAERSGSASRGFAVPVFDKTRCIAMNGQSEHAPAPVKPNAG